MTTQDKKITSEYTGILQPKMRNRFNVTFDNGADDLSALSMQTMMVSTFDVLSPLLNKFGISVKDEIQVVIEDDVTNKANTAVRCLLNQQFTLKVTILNGFDNVVESYTFEDAEIIGIQVDQPFDYGCGSNTIEFGLNSTSPEFNKEVNSLGTIASAIYHALRKINIWFTAKQRPSMAVTKILTISYSSVTHKF
ncbi:MAG: hypothetical protein EO766_11735 [Hydrotalea sp. AMD]|uniref:hypothetical protein n=1 Tax=Hydrotalea sp. AMD TaxID=2501297 RepID=UPI0010260447|nr:hypothetical protein [Hydrotalea sp. AMD]RWZ87195.1 MAG: hypothetical protein EO766_11735 [Hydrotalea sp. AMD]